MPYTNLNIARLANAALEGFVKELLPLNVFSRSYSPDVVGRTQGNVVLVPLIGGLVATTFGGTYAITTFAKSVVTVTINRHKIVPITMYGNFHLSELPAHGIANNLAA